MFQLCKILGRIGRPDPFARRLSSTIPAAFVLIFLAGLAAPLEQAQADLKMGGVDYLSLKSTAAYFGMKRTWAVRGQKLALSSDWTRLQFESDRRYFLMNERKVYLGFAITRHRTDLYLSRTDFEKTLKPLLTPQAFTPVPSRPVSRASAPGGAVGAWASSANSHGRRRFVMRSRGAGVRVGSPANSRTNGSGGPASPKGRALGASTPFGEGCGTT